MQLELFFLSKSVRYNFKLKQTNNRYSGFTKLLYFWVGRVRFRIYLLYRLQSANKLLLEITTERATGYPTFQIYIYIPSWVPDQIIWLAISRVMLLTCYILSLMWLHEVHLEKKLNVKLRESLVFLLFLTEQSKYY